MKYSFILLFSFFFLLGFILYSINKKVVLERFENEEKIQGISDGWYINLDRSTDRKAKVEEEIKKIKGLSVQRWPAVNGSALTDKDFDFYSIPAWSRPSFAKDEKKRKNELGCILSHKTLLHNLEKLDVKADQGHLILEDDISIDAHLPAVWNKALKAISSDWDIIFLGISGNKINSVKDGIGIPEWITGTHAYVVKHSSLPKINESLRVVYDPIDEMFGRNPNKLKIFALSPSMINQNNSQSTIV